jgi:uncharacterized membrane-anchored protein YjiN (DUF445 family)
MTAPESPWSRPDDAARQAQLDVMKRRATGLLALAAAVFGAAAALEHAYPWLGYVRATAEASLVGGFADWFAVTALFRHPLGLPIPHTAIVATRKERIDGSWGRLSRITSSRARWSPPTFAPCAPRNAPPGG